MEIATPLARHRLIALDTCVFIYLMERHAKYFHLANAVFERIDHTDCSAIASTVALTEILVQPYKNANLPQAESFYCMLTTMPNLEWVAPHPPIANSAASLRASYRLQTPDALIAATAIFCGATALVTNDPIFTRIPSFDTLVLDRFI